MLTKSVVGPKQDGFIIEVESTKTKGEPRYEVPPYWIQHQEYYPLNIKGQFIRVPTKEGLKLKDEYRLQLIQILGQNFKDR